MPLGDNRYKYAYWEKFNAIFKTMTREERVFVEEVRVLYWLAAKNVPGSGEQRAGSAVFCGAHVVVTDCGELYEDWRRRITDGRLNGGKRWSSHYRHVGTQQYEVSLPQLGCVLFGKLNNGKTWFQNESWAASQSWPEWLAHGVLGFGAHVLSGFMQVGALGFSIHSEKTNLELKVQHDQYWVKFKILQKVIHAREPEVAEASPTQPSGGEREKQAA